jgi:site-specific recombinase XerC
MGSGWLGIMDCFRNGDLKAIYVGLYGNPNSEVNLDVKKNVEVIRQRRANLVAAKRARHQLAVHFYSASTAPVWDMPS